MVKRCAACKREFKAIHARNRCCSRTCAVLVRKGPKRKTNRGKPNAQCAHCGMAVFRKRYSLRKSTLTYCSRACQHDHFAVRYSGKNNPNFQNSGWKKCQACGRDFHSYTKNRRYCGTDCSAACQVNEVMANLRRGADAERACVLALKQQGYAAFRSAASRGAFDVIGIGPDDILLIQVKRTKKNARRNHPATRESLIKAKVPNHPCIKKELWCWVDRKGWYKQDCRSEEILP